MQKVMITPDIMEYAKSSVHCSQNSMFIMKGDGNIAGFLGEYMVQYVFPSFNHVDKFSHDFQSKDMTFEVRTRRKRPHNEPLG